MPRIAARRESAAEAEKGLAEKIKAAEERKQTTSEAIEVASADYRAWKSGIEAERQKEEQVKNGLRAEFNRIKAALEENAVALKGVPAAYDGPASMVLKFQIAALDTAANTSTALDKAVAETRQLTVQQEIAKTLEQESARMVSTLLAKTAETANAAVNKYMPEHFRATLDLETAQWSVIGVDDRPHGKRVMAGSEFGALLPSLGLAWTEGAPGRFLTLDDEDLAFFDPDNLLLLLQALKDACDEGFLTQVFIAWSRPHEIPDSWGQKIFVDRDVEADLAAAPSPDFAALGGPAAVPVVEAGAGVIRTEDGAPLLL
jgi:flagellar biosynthesis regulator FlaF